MLLVLSLLALVLAFSLPDYGRMAQSQALLDSAKNLRTLIVLTRAQAMQAGVGHRIFFPGTADPNDRYADKEIDVPFETKQPEVERQKDPLMNPHVYEGTRPEWMLDKIMQDGTRCVAVLPGKPHFGIRPDSEIAGPSVTEDLAEFVRLGFNADGTTSWVTFVLTDLPFDEEPEERHVGRILNVIVDGRTGQTWIQRALRVEEVEVMQEYNASPILHQDFTDPTAITEANILEVHMRDGKGVVGGRRRSGGE